MRRAALRLTPRRRVISLSRRSPISSDATSKLCETRSSPLRLTDEAHQTFPNSLRVGIAYEGELVPARSPLDYGNPRLFHPDQGSQVTFDLPVIALPSVGSAETESLRLPSPYNPLTA